MFNIRQIAFQADFSGQLPRGRNYSVNGDIALRDWIGNSGLMWLLIAFRFHERRVTPLLSRKRKATNGATTGSGPCCDGLLGEHLKQLLRVDQVRCLEAFLEPRVNCCQSGVCFAAAMLLVPEPT